MSASRVESVERALTILNIFRTPDDSYSLKEIAAATGFYKSTILRIAGSLERFGYLVRENDGNYKAGQGLLRFADTSEKDRSLEHVIRPVLRELTSLTGETASYYIREQEHRICLFREIGSGELRHYVEEGARFGLNSGAPSKALLASAEERDHIFVSIGERIPGIAGIAVPVLLHGEIQGALTLSGSSDNFTDQRCLDFGKILKEFARNISAML